jgi:hypothetical protein
MAKTKGISVTNLCAFVEERSGVGSWERLLGELSDSDKEAVAGLTAIQWFDLGVYARLLNTMDTVFGAGDLVLVRELGRWGAERDLNAVFRILLRVVHPSYLLKKTTQVWQRYHDSGTWPMEAVPAGARGRLRGLGVVDRALCAELLGYLPRLVELVGGRNVRCEHTACRADGAADCEFSATWD